MNEVMILRNEDRATCVSDMKWLDFVSERCIGRRSSSATVGGTSR